MSAPNYDNLTAVMPALDEEGSIAGVIRELQTMGVQHIVVGDNGSTDRTAEIARGCGATVVQARQRGYGHACLAAIAAMPAHTEAILFCDADGADDLRMIPAIAGPVLRGDQDIVIGSRTLGRAAKGALSAPQVMGNMVSTAFMRLLYRVKATDLGPFRCITTACFQRMHMAEHTFGWTAEMQVKAFRLGLRLAEVPVDARVRTAGVSKISGRFAIAGKVGWAILRTIWHYHRAPMDAAIEKRPSPYRQRSRKLLLQPLQVQALLQAGATE